MNPFTTIPMIYIGLYAATMQQIFMGNSHEVTRDQLGHLGGNPRFVPPPPNSRYIPDSWWYRL